jgi:hypothetical protein
VPRLFQRVCTRDYRTRVSVAKRPNWRNKRRHCREPSSMRCFFAGIPTSSSHPKACPTTPPHSVCFAQLLIQSDNTRLRLRAKAPTSPPGQFIPHWTRCLACLNCATLTGQEASARATRSNGYQRTCCWPPPGILSAHATKLKAPYATQASAALPSATVNRRPRPGAKLRIPVRRGPWAAAWRSFGAFALARVSMKAELDRRSHRRSPFMSTSAASLSLHFSSNRIRQSICSLVSVVEKMQ